MKLKSYIYIFLVAIILQTILAKKHKSLSKKNKDFDETASEPVAEETQMSDTTNAEPTVDSKILNNDLLDQQLKNHEALLRSVDSYLKPSESSVSLEYPQFSWQYNINYIEPDHYQTLINRIIYTRPISQWPLVVRYLVFPQIYGYYSIPVLTNYIKKLYDYETTVHKYLFSPNFDVNTASQFYYIDNKDMKKLDLLERLARLEQLKREVDQNLLTQTQQLLEGKEYEEKVERLVKKVSVDASKYKEVESILQNIL